METTPSLEETIEMQPLTLAARSRWTASFFMEVAATTSLMAKGGTDRLQGGSGHDTLLGGDGNDWLGAALAPTP